MINYFNTITSFYNIANHNFSYTETLPVFLSAKKDEIIV